MATLFVSTDALRSASSTYANTYEDFVSMKTRLTTLVEAYISGGNKNEIADKMKEAWEALQPSLTKVETWLQSADSHLSSAATAWDGTFAI
jgi:hypothetical protein